jgi:hypothetical protein
MMRSKKAVSTSIGTIIGCDQLDQDRKTYNSGDLLVVTHLTTNLRVDCLYRAEWMGSLVISYSVDTKALNFTISSNAAWKRYT